MSAITNVKAIKVLNSRGDWTIKAYLDINGSGKGWSIVPEGASKGGKEAVCLEADKSIEIIETIIKPAIINKEFKSQQEFDELLINLDGTKDKSKLGGNSMLALSQAFSRAFAGAYDVTLWGFLRHEFLHTPGDKAMDIFEKINVTPLFNILNGGKHAQNGLSFQEFMVIPAKKYQFSQALEIGRVVYKSLKVRLEKDGYSTGVGDEGGFAPLNFNVRKALQYISDCASEHYKVGEDVFLGMDVASGTFYKNGKYVIPEEKLELGPEELKNYYSSLLSDYPIIYLEDLFQETDDSHWQAATKDLGSRIMVCADDLVVTNPEIMSAAIEKKLANSVIVKPNQVGTVWEALKFVAEAKESGWNVVVSHRSGDTEDTFIADLAYALGADFVKFGAVDRGERTSKFNRLLEISRGI